MLLADTQADTERLKIIIAVISLFAGGAMGSIITIIWNSYRTRMQPVSYSMSKELMFASPQKAGTFVAKLVAFDSAREDLDAEHFDYMFLVRVTIVNTGNSDIPEFVFGITCRDDDRIVYCIASGEDRHHVIEHTPAIIANELVTKADFKCAPFNRGDVYSAIIYVSPPEGQREVDMPKITSPAPVRLSMAPKIGDLINDVTALSAQLNLPGGSLMHLASRVLFGARRSRNP